MYCISVYKIINRCLSVSQFYYISTMYNNNNDNEIQDTENADEWIIWIEEAIAKGYWKYFEYEHFSNVQEIGSGASGKVFRANWKNAEHYLALKSFSSLNNVTVKEIIREVILLIILHIIF